MVISAIAGVNVVLLEVVLVGVTNEWLVELCLLWDVRDGGW